MRNVLSSLSTALSLGIVLALLAASAPAAYAANGTAPRAPSSRSSAPLTPQEEAKGTQADPAPPVCEPGNMPYTGATWMYDLFPCLYYRKLSEIAIPGSHDSATYAFDPLDDFGFATTQDEDITQQLNDGMRSLDIRVIYQDSGVEGAGWYAFHGNIVSRTLTLKDIFTQITNWAKGPGHFAEIIKLNVSIAGGDDKKDCSDFGDDMVVAGTDLLVTPKQLVDYFGTTNPGELTLGQLWWSLPHAGALVIMSNIPCLQEATGQTLPEWGAQGGYYADQCSANGLDYPGQTDGMYKRVLAAAADRYTGDGTYGPRSPPGNLYELDVQGTPAATPSGCWVTPLGLLPDQRQVINALFPLYYGNLNYVVADYVEKTELLAQVVEVNSFTHAPGPPEITRVTTGDGQVTVYFADTNSGTLPITSYTALSSGASAETATGPSSPLTVTGLINGQTYDIVVLATNLYGNSNYSDAVTITVGLGPSLVSLPAANGIVGEPYSSRFVFAGSPAPAVSPENYKLLPPGLIFHYPTGALTGTPTTAGSYKFEVDAENDLGLTRVTATITISAGVSAKIAGCSPRAGNNAWGCALDVTLPSLPVDTVFSVGIGGGGFPNPSGGDRPQVTAFQGCQVAPIPSPYYAGNGGYNHYDVNISSGGCTDGAVVVLEEAVTAAAGATITQSVTLPGLNTSTATFVLPPPGEPGSASPAPSWSQSHRPRLNCSGSRSSAARIAAIIGGSCRN